MFGATAFLSGYTMTYDNFHGSLPGYPNRKPRSGANDIDPDKEAFSMAPHGDEAYERVHMDDHEHEGSGSYNNRYGDNPFSGRDPYGDEDPNRYGALPPRNNGAFFDSETEYHSGGAATSPPPTAPVSMPYRPPVDETPAQFPQANYGR